MNELSLEKQAKVLGTIQSMLNTSKEGVKNFAKNVSGSSVRAEKAAVETAETQSKNLAKLKEQKEAIPRAGGKRTMKRAGQRHRDLNDKIQKLPNKETLKSVIEKGPANIAAAEAATAKARKQLAIGAGGVAAAGAGALALRAALKRGSKKGIVSMSKKQKLIKMMKKNPKTTAAAGVGGGVGLAALLSK